MFMIEIILFITVFLNYQCLLMVSNHSYKALYFFIHLIDFWVLLYCLLVQIYCVKHSILWEQQWVLVDSDIVLKKDRIIIVDEIEDRNRRNKRCEWGLKTLWGSNYPCSECLLLYRRSLRRGLLFSHNNSDDEGNSDVKLVGGGCGKEFWQVLHVICYEFSRKWLLEPTF